MTSIGAREEGRRDGEPERLGGLEVDHQLEFGRLFDGKIGRFCPLQDPIHVGGGSPLDIKTGYAVRHQAAAIADPCRSSVHRRQFVAGCELTHFCTVNKEYALGRDDETIRALSDTGVERSRKIIRRGCRGLAA
jgi:hypothetical protein